MKFEEALKAMRGGEICSVNGKGEYRLFGTSLEFRQTYLCKWVRTKNPVDYYTGLVWEIYEEPKKPLTFYEALKIVEDGGVCECLMEETFVNKRTMRMVGDYIEFTLNGKFSTDKIYQFDFDAEWYEV